MLNVCVLVGRLVKEPELKAAENGMSYSYNTLAVDEGESCTFIQLVLYGKVAESVNKCLSKGAKVGVNGKLRSRKYEAKDGTTREILELHVDSVEFLDSKKETEEVQEPAPQPQKSYKTYKK